MELEGPAARVLNAGTLAVLWPDQDPDVAHEAMALLGVALGVLGAAGLHHLGLFVLLDLLYLSLFGTGQRWLGFQWDIALLETSFLALLYCPVWSRSRTDPLPLPRKTRGSNSLTLTTGPSAAARTRGRRRTSCCAPSSRSS